MLDLPSKIREISLRNTQLENENAQLQKEIHELREKMVATQTVNAAVNNSDLDMFLGVAHTTDSGIADIQWFADINDVTAALHQNEPLSAAPRYEWFMGGSFADAGLT